MSNEKMIPGSRPKMTAAEVAAKFPDPPEYPVQVIGMRGYYKETMGNPEHNDIGVYDDAVFVVGPGLFRSFNANTDPSKQKPGIATLKPGGPYLYKIGMHNMSNPYEALRQFGDVVVTRDGKPGEFKDSPKNRFYIDIHKGGYGTTSSEGCQTIHPDQWVEFLNLVKSSIRANNQEIIPYYLIDVS